jgi:amino acid transporter
VSTNPIENAAAATVTAAVAATAAASAAEATPPAAPQGRLRRELSSFGVLMLTLSCVSPVFSIFGVGGDVLQHAGSGAAVLFLFGIAAAVVWAVVYAELGSAFPYAGGDYVGVGSILGPWAGFVSLAVWAVTSGPAIAMEARVIAVYVGDLTHSTAPMLATYGSLIAALAFAMLAVRASAFMTGVFLGVEMLAVAGLIGAGLWHPARSLTQVLLHPMVVDGTGRLAAISVGTLALGAVSAAYATVGGNQAIGYGEELQQPHRNMGRVIVLAGLIGAVACALPVICVVLGAHDLVATFTSAAPFTVFIAAIAGPMAGRALSAIVILAIFNALIAQIMFSSRLFFSIGRDGIFQRHINRLLASVHGPSGAPRGATLAVGVIAAACCLLATHVLIIFSQGVVSYTLALVCVAVLVGRRHGLTGQAGYWRSPLFPLAPILGLGLALAFCIADLLDADAGRPSILALAVVVAIAVLWHHFVLQRRPGGWRPRLG